MSDWQPFSSAPKAPYKPFFALNHDREIWVAAFDKQERLMFRTNGRYEPRKFAVRIIDGERLLKEDEEYAKAGECWQNQWCFWSRLYEFKPTHWLPIPAPPASVDTHPKGGDAKQDSVRSKGSAVAKPDASRVQP